MNLIEQLGGYEAAKTKRDQINSTLENSELLGGGDAREGLYERLESIDKALLEHRCAHNIFEIGDLYVFTEKYSKQSVIHKVDSLNSGKGCIRHATNEEIKAGRRL